jgi:hypothetical protein
VLDGQRRICRTFKIAVQSNEACMRASVTSFVRDNRSDPSEGIVHVTLSTRDQVNMTMEDRLTRDHSDSCPNIKSLYCRIFRDDFRSKAQREIIGSSQFRFC